MSFEQYGLDSCVRDRLVAQNTWSSGAEFSRDSMRSGVGHLREDSPWQLPGLTIETKPAPMEQAPAPRYGKLSLNEFPAAALRLFDRLDVCHRGFLTQCDLGQAMQDKRILGQDAQVLATLHRHYELIQGRAGHNSAGLTRDDIAALSKEVSSTDQNNDREYLISCLTHALDSTADSQSPSICHELYRNLYDPISCISARDIRQGVGDCYFEATVAALAQRCPVAIANMIRDNGNGTYSVIFPGDPEGKIYTVSSPTEAELGMYNHGNGDGAWASILEKAFGAYRQRHEGINVGQDPADGADHAGWSIEVLGLVTGHSASWRDLNDFSDSCLVSLLASINQRSRTIITADSAGKSDTGTTADGFVSAHCYTVLGLTWNAQQGYSVVVRNPWGYNINGASEIQQVPLATFRANFVGLNIGTV